MPINEREYQRILDAVDRVNAVDQLAAYRAALRRMHRDDPRLAEIEETIDVRAHDLRNG